jgi:uncharacterized protein involved in cysteine biosynthesis
VGNKRLDRRDNETTRLTRAAVKSGETTMSITSSVHPARKTWLAILAKALAVITLSCVVSLLASTFAAIIAAATCAIVVVAADALVRASRTIDTIFDEELGAPRDIVVPLRSATK